MDSTLIVAVCALVVSVFSTVLAVWSAFVQRRHMRLSVSPIPTIPISDFENRQAVFLSNKGLGPMRVKSLRVHSSDGVVHDDIISHMPELAAGVHWSGFYDRVDGAAVEHGKGLRLLLLEGDPEDSKYAQSRDAVRTALADLTIVAQCEDMYGQMLDPVTKKLRFFGRHERRRPKEVPNE